MSTPLKRINLAASSADVIFSRYSRYDQAGLDPFVDKVVPLSQERGVFRTEYAGTTLPDTRPT